MNFLTASEIYDKLKAGEIVVGDSVWKNQVQRERIKAFVRWELYNKAELTAGDLAYGLVNGAFFKSTELKLDPLWARAKKANPDATSLAYNTIWMNREEPRVKAYLATKEFQNAHPVAAIDCVNNNCKLKITSISLISMTFTSDHRLMKAYDADWRNAGALYSKPDWASGHGQPVSQTMDTPLSVMVSLSIFPVGAEEEQGRLRGVSFGGFVFEGSSSSFAPGIKTVAVSSQQKLPKEVQRLTLDIEWWVDGMKALTAPDRTSNDIYVTMGTPESVSGQETGITLKRMNASVGLVGGIGSLNPHKIAETLKNMVKGYTLVKNPDVPIELNHPQYFNSVGGAWPLIDYLDKKAECQAIIRMVLAVIKQVGCPGTAEIVMVWADPDQDGGKTPIEVVNGRGLNGRKKQVGDETWYAMLLDKPVVKGGRYHFRSSDEPNYVGRNNFEACLRLTYEGKTAYYGGGAGTYSSATEVLHAFHALAWVRYVHPDSEGNPIELEVMEVVATYR